MKASIIGTKRQRFTARQYKGIAGIIQHQLFIGILFTLDLIVLATMLGIFFLGSQSTNRFMIYAIVVVFAYSATIISYYFVLRFMARPLKTIEMVEKALAEMAQSEQIFKQHRVLPEEKEAGGLVTAYNNLARRLHDVEASQSEFLSLAAHELRSPTAAIVGYADLLGQPEYNQDEKFIAACHNVITRQGNHLLQLVDDVTVTAKLQSGTRVFKLVPLDLGELTEEVVADQRCKTEREITFENQAGPVCIQGDPLRLREALVNLIDNALKYSAADEPVHVCLSPGNKPGWVEIAVQDYGVGIDDKEKSKLFTRFGRIKNVRTQGIPGTGLGLFIVKTIVQRHCGRITVDSQPEVGSTFTIDLPMKITSPVFSTKREIL